MMTNQTHSGYAATGRTGGALLCKINAAKERLEKIPPDLRDKYWEAAVEEVRRAEDLLSQGRRAKAGKIFADAKDLINWVAVAQSHIHICLPPQQF